jgi:predicted NBD/HSP70 family sugar kinase
MRFLRGAVADLAGVVRARGSRAVTPASVASAGIDGAVAGPRERVAEVVRLTDDLCARAGIDRPAVTRAVVGSPGVYDRQRDVITLTGGLPGWDQPEALAGLRAAFGPALSIENDVDAAALAERAHGHGRDVDDFAFVHVGTGIGMGLVLDGRLRRGAHAVAGEIAFLPLPPPDGWPAPPVMGGPAARSSDGLASDGRASAGLAAEARRRGLLETAAAADGIVRAAHRAGLRAAASPRDVFEAAGSGDERAIAVVTAEARLVASAICCVITVVDPSLVVLGGGVGQAAGFADAVTAELAAIAPVMPEVRVSALGTDAVVDGCLAEATSLAWTGLVAALP